LSRDCDLKLFFVEEADNPIMNQACLSTSPSSAIHVRPGELAQSFLDPAVDSLRRDCGSVRMGTHRAIWQGTLRLVQAVRDFAIGIPVRDTIVRVVCRINPKQFQQCFLAWMAAAMKPLRSM